MLLLACVLAGCILGWMRGGKLRNFLSFPFRFLWLPCGAFLLQASVLPFSRWIPGEPDRWLWLPLVLSYSMLAIFFIGNYRIPERSCDCSERVAYACAGGDGICNDRDAETPVYAFGK